MDKRRLGEAWHEKVNTAFVRYYRALKANAAIGRIKDYRAAKKEFDRQWGELCAANRGMNEEASKMVPPAGRASDAGMLQPLDGEVWPWPIEGKPGKAYVTNPEASSFFRILVFLKYGVTFRELVTEIERNPKAYTKWLRVHEDFYHLRCGKRSIETLQLKFNMIHFRLIEHGLAFGLDRLNQWELADCFDEICSCGSTSHSAEYLVKLRRRVIKAVKSLRDRNSKSTSIDLS